jgi:putative ABC transport system permease protein
VVTLLRLIAWPYFRTHKVRTLLTTAGIVLGVAVFVGMHAANRSVLFAFSQTVDRIAGKTELQVTAGDTGFGEDLLETVQAAKSVRIAVPVIEATVDPKLPGQGSLFVLGIDMTGDRSLREYDLDGTDDVVGDPLVFLAQPDSLIVSRTFAEKNQLTSGSRIALGTVDGEKVFVIRGIMKSSGLASAFGGNLAIMDIYAAQKMFGRGRTFDRIDLAVKEGVSLTDCERELGALLGPAFEIQPPSARGQQFEAVLSGYAIMVSVSSAFALFIGLFIIYNALSIGVTQRRTEIGVLRAIGATRAQIRAVFIGESAIIGLIGSCAGLVVGAVMARTIAAYVSALIADMYGVSEQAITGGTDPLMLLEAVVLGVATSVIAGIIPARNAALVSPVEALQKGNVQTLSAVESRTRMVSAVAAAVLAALCLVVGDTRTVFYVGYASALGAAVLSGPVLAVLLARAMRPVVRWIRPVEGALATDSLIQTPRRTSATVVALMLSVALIVAFGGMARASYASIVDWMDTTLSPDLFVMPTAKLELQAARFPDEMTDELKAIPGVRIVQRFRNGRFAFRGAPAMIVALEMDSVARTERRRPVAGNTADMYRRAAAREGVIVSDNLAQLQKLSLGEIIEIPAPYGVIRLPIAGIVVDYSDQQGAILIDRTLFTQYWRDDTSSDFRLYVQPGADVAQIRTRVLQRYAGRRQVFVLTNRELKAYILKATDQWFGLTSIQVAIAVLVAILGIVNALTVSITDRRRELGVLRAVGALNQQVRLTIWIEALAVAAIGLTLGIVVGAANLFYVLEIVRRDVVGMRLEYLFPFGTIAALIPIIAAAGFVAALWPAQSAVRGSLVEALEYE